MSYFDNIGYADESHTHCWENLITVSLIVIEWFFQRRIFTRDFFFYFDIVNERSGSFTAFCLLHNVCIYMYSDGSWLLFSVIVGILCHCMVVCIVYCSLAPV